MQLCLSWVPGYLPVGGDALAYAFVMEREREREGQREKYASLFASTLSHLIQILWLLVLLLLVLLEQRRPVRVATAILTATIASAAGPTPGPGVHRTTEKGHAVKTYLAGISGIEWWSPFLRKLHHPPSPGVQKSMHASFFGSERKHLNERTLTSRPPPSWAASAFLLLLLMRLNPFITRPQDLIHPSSLEY